MAEKVAISSSAGKIRGIKQTSRFSNKEFYSFFGVPYGKPPINKLRFKDPVEATPWANILDATSEKQGCVQFSFLTFQLLGTEDCLFNNIHIPELPGKNHALRPVIIHIHPGAYSFGSPHTEVYGSPEFIMHHDVVYVCISYRLHILGFLNLRLKECSGNQAIKDIILSLRWINDHICSFGGDSENITLIGSSSGAVIIHILMLSPSAKGLFHKAVLMGGYLTVPSVPLQKSNENYARQIAEVLGYKGDPEDSKKLLLFLKKQEATLLIEGCRRCQKAMYETIAPIFPIGAFSPTFDQGDILPQMPKKLIESMARIPIILGVTEHESVTGFIRGFENFTEKNFRTSSRQNIFGWGYHLSDEDVQLINKKVEAFYLNGQAVEQATLPIKMNIQTDISMSDIYDTVINPISADLPSSAFVYKFEFEGNIVSRTTILKDLVTGPIKGTTHFSDFGYWNFTAGPQDGRTQRMIETFSRLITTFARKGDPNYENLPTKWRPSTILEPCFLSINDPIEMVRGKLNHDRLEFWDRIKKKYNPEENENDSSSQ